MLFEIRDLFTKTHETFEWKNFNQISINEKQIKTFLKEIMKLPKFKKLNNKLSPSL